jgi:hypothetical protein
LQLFLVKASLAFCENVKRGIRVNPTRAHGPDVILGESFMSESLPLQRSLLITDESVENICKATIHKVQKATVNHFSKSLQYMCLKNGVKETASWD